MNTRYILILALVGVARLGAQIEVLSNGNVGIGTTSPASKVDINTTARLNASASAGTSLSGASVTTNGGDILTGRIFLNGSDQGSTFQSGGKLLGFNNEQGSGRLVLYNYTANQYLVTFKHDGNVGVGTTSPANKVDINTTARLNAAASAGTSLAGAAVATNGGDILTGRLFFNGSDQGSTFQSGGKLLGFNNEQGSGRLVLYNYTDNQYLITFKHDGNVGIGTNSPGAALHVKGPNGTQISGKFEYQGGMNFVDFVTGNGGGNYGSALRFIDSNVTNAQIISTANSNLVFFTGSNSTPNLALYSSGNVGIGTSGASYKLEVGGSVRATSFISNSTTYADFVFDPGYRLTPLSEVEAHIREKRHLPGIPSESDAKEHGIDLADMQVKLLQKIEELTLHQIAQEKEIAALRQELAVLKQR